VTAALVVGPGSTALGLEYPCPSAPGFCYFDVASDRCFDSGTDVGPIGADLAAGDYPNPLPPGAARAARDAWGDRVSAERQEDRDVSPDMELVSGRDLAVADIKLRSLTGRESTLLLRGERDARLAKKILQISTNEKHLDVVAATGDIFLNNAAVKGLHWGGAGNTQTRFETSDTSVSILDSQLSGPSVFVEVVAGPGSTCDLTGMTLVTGVYYDGVRLVRRTLTRPGVLVLPRRHCREYRFPQS